MRRAFLTIGSVILVMGNALSAEYFVSPRGLDSNLGTQAEPWKTIQKAASSATHGDTVRVAEGIYPEIVTLKEFGSSGGGVVFDGQGVAQVHRFIVLSSGNTIQNFRMHGLTEGSWFGLITLGLGAHRTTVSNNVLDASGTLYVSGIEMAMGSPPFDARAASYCNVISNVITGVRGRDGLAIGGNFNVFRGNRVADIIQSDFVRLFGGTNSLIGNVFSNAVYDASIGYHTDFIQTFGDNGHGSRGHTIEGNLVSDIPYGQLCQLVETRTSGSFVISDWVFKNNIFARIAAQASVSIPNTKWYNNVFYRCNYNSADALGFGNTERGSGNGVEIINNLFIDCGQAAQDNVGWYSVSALTNYVADFNMVTKNGYKPVRQGTFPNEPYRWFEQNGINGGNPQLFSEANLDFRLSATSPLVFRGKFIPVVTADFVGRQRPNSPTIGAFEPGRPKAPIGLKFLY